jgi:hypothetical protein
VATAGDLRGWTDAFAYRFPGSGSQTTTQANNGVCARLPYSLKQKIFLSLARDLRNRFLSPRPSIRQALALGFHGSGGKK